MEPDSQNHLIPLLAGALAAREGMLDERHEGGLRLFNGFLEGYPDLAVDLYGTTLILHNYGRPAAVGLPAVAAARAALQEQLPWIDGIVVKSRHADDPQARIGRQVAGGKPVHKIREDGIWYAVDPFLNLDAGLYLDTRLLRRWLRAEMRGRTLLNTFAYTGSLGVAAAAGGAARVVQTDRNRRYLNVAKDSYTMNGFPIVKGDFQTADFWPHMKRLQRAGELFDCAIIDPPFFTETSGGRADLAQDMPRLINKVRPLIRDGGRIVAINNALFASGRDYLADLETIMEDGYVTLEERIDVPADFTGFPETRAGSQVTDPAPFNHSTKIAVLRIRHRS